MGADGAFGIRRVWCCCVCSSLSPCVSPCVLLGLPMSRWCSLCPTRACLTIAYEAALFPVGCLCACLPTWCTFPFCWRTHYRQCALWEGM